MDGSIWPFMVCTGTVKRVVGDTFEQFAMPILCTGADRETARGRALTLLEDAFPFGEGWTGHYVTDALNPLYDTVLGMPMVIVRLVGNEDEE